MGDSFRVYFQVKESEYSDDVMKSIGEALRKALPEMSIIPTKPMFSETYAIFYTIENEIGYYFILTVGERANGKPWFNSRIPKDYVWLCLSVQIKTFRYFIWGDDDLLYGSEGDKEFYRRLAVEATEDFLTCVRIICEISNPMYAAGGHEATFEWKDFNFEDYLYKINYFSPERVEEFGRSHLLATPAWRVDELENGGILLVTDRDFTREVKNWKKAVQYLGLKLGSEYADYINRQETD